MRHSGFHLPPPPSRGDRGSTLIETLIAAALFLLALVLCGQLSVLGMRSQSTTVDKNQAFRWGTAALDQLNRDLAHTTEIYLPTTLTGIAFKGTAASEYVFHPVTTSPLVLQSSSINGGPTVVGYWLDSTTGNLTRVIYEPDYNTTAVATQVVLSGQKPKTIATWVSDFAIYGVDLNSEYGAKTVQAQLVLSTVAPGSQGPTVMLQGLTRLRAL